MSTFSFQDRQENLKRMQTEKFDLVIIGGGINGAGIARDASLRGMSVALVEAADFASGTSSRSSKLIHGGIRYLENLEFHLVFEALSERQKLFEIAPHLVHHLRFLIPLYQSGRVGMFKMGLGMWLYDALALFQAPEMHERLNIHETLARFPDLQSKGLLGSYVYSDAYMDDDRLTIETLRSAARSGACCANYVQALSADFSQNKKVKSIIVQDQISQKKFQIQGRHFVSTVGPWSDILGAQFFQNWKGMLRPTKGVHLTFEKKRIQLQSAVVMGTEERVVFGIPRHEMVIIGTTDTDFSGNPSDVKTTQEDVNYLLGVAEKYFPGAGLKKEDIIASYAGVRPLVKDDSSSEGKTSREHTILTEEHGVTFVAGGKYTTYRLIAEQAVQEVLKYFPIEDRVRFGRGQSDQPINPFISAESFSARDRIMDRLQKNTSLSKESIRVLVDRHGDEVFQILEQNGEGLDPLEYEAHHAIEHTMCLNLVDFFTRRTHLFLAERDHGRRFLEKLKSIFQERLSLSDSEIQGQVQSLEDHIGAELAWTKKR